MSDITDAEARAALYGITDDQKVQAFGAYGIELDFAGGFYRKGHQIKATPSDIDGWSFSRGSVAVVDVEGAIQSFPQDVPRIVADLGLAIEPAAQNLLLRSQQFDHVKWDKINVGSGLAPVVVADDAPAPDGTMTADRISLSLDGGTGTGDRCHLQQDLAPVLDAKYGGSLFVKGVDGEKIIFRHVAGTDYLLHTFDGTWQRIEIVETATGTARFFEFGLRGGFGTSDTVSFHAWGGQIEAGDNITSYVPSGEFSATRDKDNAILDGLAFGTCTVLIDATLTTGAANSERGRRAFAVLYLGSGVDDNVTIVNNDAGGTGSVVTAAGALSGVSTATAVAATGDRQSIALRIATEDTQMVRNGVLGNWLFDSPIPASMNTLHVGGSPLSTLARLGGVIHKITIVPFALTDSEMLVLTGGDAYPAGDVTWLRATKAAAFSPRDSAETFKLGGYHFIANGFQPVGVGEEQARHDLWRSVNGVDFELVNDAPEYDKFSKVVALDGVIYAWRAKMFKSVDGGASFTQIMATLPWGVSAFDNPALVHEGKLLFFHGTGNDPVEGTEGVWQFDPVEVEWTLICPAPWGARGVAVIAQFNGDLYLCGGQRNVANIPAEVTYPGKTTLNDIWKSVDGGETWTQTVADLPMAPRMWPAFIAYAGRLYLMGGYDNIGPANCNYADTWVSEDGASWSRLYATRDYLQRHAPVAYVVNSELFLTSGNANAAAPGSVLNDIWRMGL